MTYIKDARKALKLKDILLRCELNFIDVAIPRLLAQNLPSNGSSLKDLKCTHSDYGASDESRIVIFRHYLPVPGVGNLRACCLPWMW